jgi:hypothetical protein
MIKIIRKYFLTQRCNRKKIQTKLKCKIKWNVINCAEFAFIKKKKIITKIILVERS